MPTKQFIVLFFVYNNHSMWWPVVLNYEDALWKCRSNLWYIGGVGSQSSGTFRRCSPTTCFDGQVLIIWEACPDEIPNIPDSNSVMIVVRNFTHQYQQQLSLEWCTALWHRFLWYFKETSLPQLADLTKSASIAHYLCLVCNETKENVKSLSITESSICSEHLITGQKSPIKIGLFLVGQNRCLGLSDNFLKFIISTL